MSFAKCEKNINQMTKRKLRIVAENYRLRLNAAAERAAMAATELDAAKIEIAALREELLAANAVKARADRDNAVLLSRVADLEASAVSRNAEVQALRSALAAGSSSVSS